MKNKLLIALLLCFVCNILVAQGTRTCEEKTNKIEDLNVIDYKKCLIKSSSTKNKDKSMIAYRLKSQLKLKVNSKNRPRFTRNSIKRKRLIKAINTKKIAHKVKNTYMPNEILFTLVDELPKFENCNNDNSVKCFNDELRTHFLKSFSYPKQAVKDKVEGRVFVRFVISKQGKIADVQTFCSGDKKILEDEIKRIVLALPKFTAGKEFGQDIDVVYSMPIDFKL